MSFTWRVENLALMNEKSNSYIGNEKIYKAENELTRQEKIDFLDSMNDGLTSYILSLSDKFREDMENGVIRKNKDGQINPISFAAWINKNDTRNCVENSTYDRGRVNFPPYRNIKKLDKVLGANSVSSDYVNDAFHIKLKDLERQEKQYFREHDKTEILKAKVFEYSDKYGTFGLNIWRGSGGLRIYKDDNPNLNGRELTLNELKLLNSKYEEMDKLYESITNDMPLINYEHEYNPQDNQNTQDSQSIIPNIILEEFINSKAAIKIDNQEQLNILLSQLQNEDVQAPSHINYNPKYSYFFVDKVTNKLKTNHNFNNISKIHGTKYCYNFSDLVDKDKQNNKQEDEPVIDLD